MINQQLLDFIKSQLLKGIDKETITKELLGSGWTNEDIEEGFNLANAKIINLTGDSSTPTPPTIDVEAYNKGKNITYTIISSFITICTATGLIFGDEIKLATDNLVQSIKKSKTEIISQIKRDHNIPITTSLSPNYLKFDKESSFFCDLNSKEYLTLSDYNSSCVSNLYNERVSNDLTINISEPNNGTIVKLGEKYNITWDINKINSDTVYIRIRDDSFGVCKSMHACYNYEELGYADNNGIFVWDTAKSPFKPGDKYKIKIEASDYKNSIYYQGLSNGYFSIALPNIVDYCPTGRDFYDSDYPNCLCPATPDNFVKGNALKSKGTNSITSMPLYEIIPGMYFCKSLNNSMVAYKPVIYLYPTQIQEVKVELDYKGKLIADYPAYDYSKKGWEVTAYPDGKIINSDGKEYSYLFWEGEPSVPIKYDLSTGFIVKGEDTVKFLQDTLSKIGLTPKEYNEFIVYWYPKMKDNKYNLIHFADKQYTDTAPLTIIPTPDSMLRVFMVFKPLDKMIEIKSQEIKSFNRTGFSVVEWGGTELKK